VTTAYAPRSLAEALEIRSEHPEATPVAGGTDLMVEVNFGHRRPEALLDLSRVEELQGWRQENGTFFLGAGTTFARIAGELRHFPSLAEAARSVGSPQIRNRATVGGNLATASPAGDSIPVLFAYDADVVLAREDVVRRVPCGEFFLGPKRTCLASDELILGAEWTPVPGPGSFAKVGPRNAMVIAVASVCVQLDEDRHEVRLALGSVGPTVLRASVAELFGSELLDWEDPAEGLAEFGRWAASEAQPIDDLRGSAAYRRHVVEVLATRTLRWALEERC
jgi:CO/xanthine dehydrogenase FAD-binding subunit